MVTYLIRDVFGLKPPHNYEQVKSVWGKIEKKYLDMLVLPSAEGEPTTFQDQFEAEYEDDIFLSTSVNRNIYTIRKIFYDNLHIVLQIGQYQKIIEQLTNFDNWQDVTKTTSVGINTNEGHSSTESDSNNLNLTSDNNSRNDESKLKALMYPKKDEQQVILANLMTQGRTNDGNKTTNTGSAMSDTTNTTKTSNASSDYINYLRLEVPQLRKMLLERFLILFRK